MLQSIAFCLWESKFHFLCLNDTETRSQEINGMILISVITTKNLWVLKKYPAIAVSSIVGKGEQSPQKSGFVTAEVSTIP